MAYKTTVSKYCANRQAGLNELWTQLEAMGWTLVDGNFSSKVVAYTAVDTTNNLFTSAGHGLPNGTPCQITSTGTIPGGLAINTQYYIVNQATDTFKLATTYNGTAIDITSQGTGNHTITESYRVYKSNGENSDRPYEYVKITYYSATNLMYFWPMYYYNISTKATVGGLYTSVSPYITTSDTGFYIWIHGNKNLVAVTTKISTTYYREIFGHFPKIQGDNTLTTLSSGIAAGNGVTVTVSGTSGFDLTSYYQIIGQSGEGRDLISFSSIINSTQMVASSVARNYAAGAFIGAYPSTFCATNGATTPTNIYFSSPLGVVGTADATGNSFGSMLYKTDTGCDPDYRSNKYILQPIMLTNLNENSSSNVSYGAPYCDEYLLYAPGTIGLTSEDTFSVGVLSTGTSTGTNASGTLNDTSKNWTVNLYTNKTVIITAGIGVGQIKKIASNTATALTLDPGWIFETLPDATSQYIICNEGYRFLAPAWYLAAREGY